MSPLPDGRTTVRALALLRERYWVLALLAVVVLSAIFVRLGFWQFHRYESKLARNDLIQTNYDAVPVPLAQVLPAPSAGLDRTHTWTPVRVQGSYLGDQQTLVRNRPLDGSVGFEVLTPLRLADGSVIVVDRGWVPVGAGADAPDAVPAAPAGTVQVVVRLRPGEPSVDREPPPGQQLRIDLTRIGGQLDAPVGTRLYQAYGVLTEQAPAPPAGITLLPPPNQSLGVNLPYAVQWWGFAIAAYVILAHYMLREARQRRARNDLPGGERRKSVDEEYEDRIQEQSSGTR